MADPEEADSLAEALGLRRQVRRGFLAGALFAAAVFVFFVGLPGARRSPVWYLGLAFVVAFAAGAVFAGVLVALAARRLVRRSERPGG